MIITIDGPAGSGKSSVATMIAKKYNFFYLSSGFIYRSFAYYLHQINYKDYHDEKNLTELIKNCTIEFINCDHKKCNVFYNQKNVTEYIKLEQCGLIAANISHFESIRSLAHQFQHQLAAKHINLVVEGRDCGTVIFPHADLKLFFNASLESRVERALERNRINNIILNKNDIKKIIEQRDLKDILRKNGTLMPAYDAFIVENSNLSIEDVFEYCCKLIG